MKSLQLLKENIACWHESSCLFRFSGDKCFDFLQGMTTADLRGMADGNWRFTSFCDHRGKVVASAYLFLLNQNWHVACNHPGNLTVLENHLKPYAMLSSVQMHHVQDRAICLAGDKKAFDRLLSLDVAVLQHAILRLKDGSLIMVLSKEPWVAMLFVSCDRHLQIKQALLASSLNLLTKSSLFRYQCFCLGHRHIHPELSAQFTPNVLGYTASTAVSLDKGCYLGQEIIARTHHLGRVNRQWVCLEHHDDSAADDFKHGQDIYDQTGKSLGQVVEINDSAGPGKLALAILHQSWALSTALYRDKDQKHQVQASDLHEVS
jgi:tRNA-modifying protein YgfZ